MSHFVRNHDSSRPIEQTKHATFGLPFSNLFIPSERKSEIKIKMLRSIKILKCSI